MYYVCRDIYDMYMKWYIIAISINSSECIGRQIMLRGRESISLTVVAWRISADCLGDVGWMWLMLYVDLQLHVVQANLMAVVVGSRLVSPCCRCGGSVAAFLRLCAGLRIFLYLYWPYSWAIKEVLPIRSTSRAQTIFLTHNVIYLFCYPNLSLPCRRH